MPSLVPLALAVAAVGALAVAANVFGVLGFIGFLHPPVEFPLCRGAAPRDGEPVVRAGGCYTSAAFPLDNDTFFCAAPVAGETVRWAGGCADTYAPPALVSLGDASLLANATALRGVAGAGLASAAASATHVTVTVPQPTHTAAQTPIADAAANAFYGWEAAQPAALEALADRLVIGEMPWELGEVVPVGLANVDSAVGNTLYTRAYTVGTRAFAVARGGMYVQYTSSPAATVVWLRGLSTAPVGSGVCWIGPGAASCGLKELNAGISAPVLTAAAYARDDGQAYLYFWVDAAFGGGTTVECTFEVAYMCET